MTPFGINSDTHNHNWHAFSTILPTGINNRLQTILDETWRLAVAVKDAGGKTMYHGGDLFHVRGNIAPSVLNPTLDLYKRIITELGVEPRFLAGNHDLEGRDAHRVTSAVTALEGIGCKVVNQTSYFSDDRVAMIPWIQDVDELKREIGNVKAHIQTMPSPPPLRSMENPSDWSLMIHAPVDGVIAGLPAHGLTNVELAAFGFKYVFCGHYHHYKNFGDGVYSIGASTHQTWSDIGSKAGFLIVDDSGVNWFKSHAPDFVEIDGDMDELEIKSLIDGAYVRAKISTANNADVENVRQYLVDNGAKGVTILTTKAVVSAARSSSTVKAGASIEESVAEFIKKSTTSNQERLNLLCASILAEARAEVAA